jgi:hypothetical protein
MDSGGVMSDKKIKKISKQNSKLLAKLFIGSFAHSTDSLYLDLQIDGYDAASVEHAVKELSERLLGQHPSFISQGKMIEYVLGGK